MNGPPVDVPVLNGPPGDEARRERLPGSGASGRHAYAIGLVLGFTAAEARLARPEIQAAWDRLRRHEPFWT